MTLSIWDLVFVGVFGGLAWYIFSGTRVRELAVAAAKRSSELADIQLLDQSVALSKTSLSRDGNGIWRVWRQYRFEYSRDGVGREVGHIIMLGPRLQAVLVAEVPTVH
ncbi:DUF3301 domain-containing protein [Congregibacter sp.]|uniref:DUF3301 domain-containing protein n=1 Tax=Congregibacter sp. TaxID=2744308 RepID=UPI00385C6181